MFSALRNREGLFVFGIYLYFNLIFENFIFLGKDRKGEREREREERGERLSEVSRQKDSRTQRQCVVYGHCLILLPIAH